VSNVFLVFVVGAFGVLARVLTAASFLRLLPASGLDAPLFAASVFFEAFLGKGSSSLSSSLLSSELVLFKISFSFFWAAAADFLPGLVFSVEALLDTERVSSAFGFFNRLG
jgi:hypothetical protein